MTDLTTTAAKAGILLSATGSTIGTLRSVAFNVQRFRVAVHCVSGAIRILQSFQAADAGRVLNPLQCRGQIEGGVAQALGAWRCAVRGGRDRSGGPRDDYHMPAFADIPRTEVLFADAYDE